MKNPVRIAINVLLVLLGIILAAYVGGVGPFDSSPSHEIDKLYDAPPDGAMRVLFVGNSHTYVNDVPGWVQRLGDADGTQIWVEQEVAGGASLRDHWESRRVHKRLSEEAWDVVVLQGQSLRPALERSAYLTDARAFSELARKHGAQPVIYATWARARWSGFYGSHGRVDKPSQLRSMLEHSFREAADATGATVAPVGTAFTAFRRQNAAVPLHSEDGNHATREGSYLAAAVLYRVLTDRPVSGNGAVPEGMDPQVAAKLQNIADSSPDRWRASAPEDVEDAAAE